MVHKDVSSKETIYKLKNQPIDEDKPGLGQYYCVECAKYFENQQMLNHHTKSKRHKRRVKELKERPYTPLESEAASGVNLVKFMESVEKYKQLEQFKQENKEEFDQLKNQQKPDLDTIILGGAEQQPADGNDEMIDE